MRPYLLGVFVEVNFVFFILVFIDEFLFLVGPRLGLDEVLVLGQLTADDPVPEDENGRTGVRETET